MEKKEIEDIPQRMVFEYDDNYEERINVYKFYLPKYGPEKAETLSWIYYDMKFLHCRYHPEVEKELYDYPGMDKQLANPESPDKVENLLTEAFDAAKSKKRS